MNPFPAPQFIRMLDNLSHCLEKAQKHSEVKKYDVNVLANSRLAPDQYDLIEQVQSACDAAKFCCARLTGKEAPKHEDNEKTFDDLKTRITKCVTYLKTFKAEDFKDSENRPIKLPYFEGMEFKGNEYLNSMSVPNFYFHVTTAYAILRHNGVDVGKQDYLGEMKPAAH